jgi:diacylglycerol kinase family enzyme
MVAIAQLPRRQALSPAYESSFADDLQPARRAAVVLNVNAHRVNDDTIEWVKSVVPRQDLFISRCLEDGPRIADELIRRRYDAVLWGGGDGTFVAGVASLVRASRQHGVALPDVGILPLGTGNAVAHATGLAKPSAEGLKADLFRARFAPAQRRLSMLEVDGKPTLFAGFGLDAQILDDLHQTLDVLKKAGNLDEKVRSPGARYALTIASRTILRFVASQRAEVVAVNRGAPAVRVDLHGNAVGAPIPAGRVIWRGPSTLAAASSIPFYGLGMKMFPHAERKPGRFQLRVSDASAHEILWNLPALWKGRWETPKVHDFLVDDVELVLSRPSPFQSGGDLVGDRTRVRLGLWRQPIALV